MNWMRGKLRVDGGGERLDRGGLGEARHALEQDVAVGEQPDQQPVDHVALADDDLADLLADAVERLALLLDLGAQRLDRGGHSIPPASLALRARCGADDSPLAERAPGGQLTPN